MPPAGSMGSPVSYFGGRGHKSLGTPALKCSWSSFTTICNYCAAPQLTLYFAWLEERRPSTANSKIKLWVILSPVFQCRHTIYILKPRFELVSIWKWNTPSDYTHTHAHTKIVSVNTNTLVVLINHVYLTSCPSTLLASDLRHIPINASSSLTVFNY